MIAVAHCDRLQHAVDLGQRVFLQVVRVADEPPCPDPFSPALRKIPSSGEHVETGGFCLADDRCRIVPCYTSFDPRGRK